MKTTILLLIGILLGIYPVLAQNENLSILETYIKEGIENNQQLLQEALAVEKSKSQMAEANGMFMPSVDFLSTYTIADGGRSIQFPVGDLLNPVYSTLNRLSDSNQFPQIDNVEEQFLPNEFHDTRFRIIQPLFNTDIYYNKKASQQMTEFYKAKKEAYKMELIKEIKVAYYQYAGVKELIKILETNRKLLIELVKFNEKRFNEGQVTVDAVYRSRYEVDQINADLATADEKEATAKAYFNFLLNRPYDTEIELDPEIEVNSLLQNTYNPSVNSAIANRYEIAQIKNAQQAQDYLIRLNQGNKLPKINGVFDAGFQGFGYQFDSRQDYWMLNFSLSWNVFNGFQRKNKIQQSRIERESLNSQEQQLKNQIALEVTKSSKEFFAAKERYNAKTSAINSAKRSYDITEKRYIESQALLIEYLDAQSSLLTAELEQVISKYELMAAKARMDQAMAL